LQASRRRVEELLWVLGLSKLTGPLWEWLRGGRAIRQSRLMREFYSVLLPKGAVVFDIGANIGTMTRVFASEGAKVIAVEPNPDCIRHIERTTSRDAVEVLQAAVGEVNGLGVIRISDRKDKMSSLSAEWREAVAKDNRDYAGMWKREITVPLITLDTLIHRYGLPFYIKIDVEGYEEHVLRGLSGRPALLSLEFNRLLLAPVLRALDSAVFAEASFNFTLIDPVRFELAEWTDREGLKDRLSNLRDGPALGDIFARNHS
jgi:FkbM family methyltransferase